MKLNKKTYMAVFLVLQGIYLAAGDNFQTALQNAQKLITSPLLSQITIDNIGPSDVLGRLLHRIGHLCTVNASLVAQIGSLQPRKQSLEAEIADATAKKAAIMRLLGVQPTSPVPTCSSNPQLDRSQSSPSSSLQADDSGLATTLHDDVEEDGIEKYVIRIGKDIVDRATNSYFELAMEHYNNREYQKAFEHFSMVAGDDSELDSVRAQASASLGAICRLVCAASLNTHQLALACFQDARDFCGEDRESALYSNIQKNIAELEELIEHLQELPPLALSTELSLQDDLEEEPVVARPNKRGERELRMLQESNPKRARTAAASAESRKNFCEGCQHQFSNTSNFNLHRRKFPSCRKESLLPPPSESHAMTAQAEHEDANEDTYCSVCDHRYARLDIYREYLGSKKHANNMAKQN